MHFNKVSRTERTKIRKMERITTSFPRQKHGMRGKNITPNEEREKDDHSSGRRTKQEDEQHHRLTAIINYRTNRHSND